MNKATERCAAAAAQACAIDGGHRYDNRDIDMFNNHRNCLGGAGVPAQAGFLHVLGRAAADTGTGDIVSAAGGLGVEARHERNKNKHADKTRNGR